MIRFSVDSIATGDTTRLVWELPAGARPLFGPGGNDSLLVVPDTARLGQWVLQPLAPGAFGGDTLVGIGSAGDTIREAIPAWRVQGLIQSTDSAARQMLPPQEVKQAFPWDLAAAVAGGIALAVALFLGWKRYRSWKAKKPVVVPKAPPRDPIEVASEQLVQIEKRSEAGSPARDTAFACGELLRALHGSLHGWTAAVESTSGQWLEWADARRPAPESEAVRQFLSEADALRYADAHSDARDLLVQARVLLDAVSRWRNQAR